jgi:hypothetical protein
MAYSGETFSSGGETSVDAELARHAQDFKIAIGIKLDEHNTEGCRVDGVLRQRLGYFKDPEWPYYWQLEHRASEQDGQLFCATRQRTMQHEGKYSPNKHQFFAVADRVQHAILFKRHMSSEPVVVEDIKQLEELGATVLRLIPLSAQEEWALRESERQITSDNTEIIMPDRVEG